MHFRRFIFINLKFEKEGLVSTKIIKQPKRDRHFWFKCPGASAKL